MIKERRREGEKERRLGKDERTKGGWMGSGLCRRQKKGTKIGGSPGRSYNLARPFSSLSLSEGLSEEANLFHYRVITAENHLLNRNRGSGFIKDPSHYFFIIRLLQLSVCSFSPLSQPTGWVC